MSESGHHIRLDWSGDERLQFLRIGDYPEYIAVLTRRTVQWSVYCELPGFRTTRTYANLEQQRADTERSVRRILDQFGAVRMPMPTCEAALCHELLDQAQIPRLGGDDLTLQLSDRIRLLVDRPPRDCDVLPPETDR